MHVSKKCERILYMFWHENDAEESDEWAKLYMCGFSETNNIRQAVLGRGFVDYSENGEQTDTQIHRYTDTHTGVPIESVPD